MIFVMQATHSSQVCPKNGAAALFVEEPPQLSPTTAKTADVGGAALKPYESEKKHQPEKHQVVKLSAVDITRKQLASLTKTLLKLESEPDLLNFSISTDQWEIILNSSQVNLFLENLSKAELPESFFSSFVECFNSHEELTPKLWEFLNLLVQRYSRYNWASRTIRFIYKKYKDTRSFYLFILQSPSFKEFLACILDYTSLSQLLALPNGALMIAQKAQVMDLHFIQSLGTALAKNPPLKKTLPILYPVEKLHQNFTHFRQWDDYYKVVKHYPYLPYPKSKKCDKLKEYLGEQSFTPLMAWHYHLSQSFRTLFTLPKEQRVALVEKLVKDIEDPTSKEILFSWATSGIRPTEQDPVILETIYLALLPKDRTNLIQDIWRNFDLFCLIKDERLIEDIVGYLLKYKDHLFGLLNFYNGVIVIPSKNIPFLDKLYASFTEDDFKKLHYRFFSYVCAYFPQLAAKIYPQISQQHLSDKLFCAIIKRDEIRNPFQNENKIGPVTERALHTFYKLIPQDKAKVYQGIIAICKDPEIALKDCHNEQIPFIQKACQLELYSILDEIVQEFIQQRNWKLLNFILPYITKMQQHTIFTLKIKPAYEQYLKEADEAEVASHKQELPHLMSLINSKN